MKSLLIASVIVAAAASALSVGKVPTVDMNYPKAWVSLFQPPYQNCPEIMLTIGCTTDNVCYVPGGSNGVGFGVYHFDGQMNGNFTALNSIDNVEFDFTLFAGIAGTATAPKGAVGGVSLWKGLKYFVNSTTLAPANVPISEEQSIAVNPTGMEVFMVDGFVESWPQIGLYSKDAGKTYKGVEINADPINKTCTLPIYQAIAAEGVWIAAAGSFPERHSSGGGGNGNNILKIVSDRTAYLLPHATKEAVEALGWKVSAKNPKIAHRSLIQLQKERAELAAKNELVGRRKRRNDGPDCPYSAAVFSTSDAGKTWTTLDFNTSYWAPNGISCANSTTCMMVGAGTGQFPGSRVLRTSDAGKTWNQVLFLPSEGGEEIWMMSTIVYNPTNPLEAWMGGGVENLDGNFAVFFYTMDGGDNWHRSSEVNFVEEIMAISFTAEGNAFAVGITQFDDSTIVRYTADGFPQTPAPVYTGNFTQVQCADSDCSVNCTSLSLPQDVCLKLNNGGSAKAHCDLVDQVLIQDEFPIDAKCTGPSVAQPQGLNVCFDLGQGQGSFKNLCGPKGNQYDDAPAGTNFMTAPKTKKL